MTIRPNHRPSFPYCHLHFREERGFIFEALWSKEAVSTFVTEVRDNREEKGQWNTLSQLNSNRTKLLAVHGTWNMWKMKL